MGELIFGDVTFDEKQSRAICEMIDGWKKIGQKEIFDKFDEYACIKNDKWYLDFKKEKMEKEGFLTDFRKIFQSQLREEKEE